jgi:membrane protease YdiL (CAAX protease family)
MGEATYPKTRTDENATGSWTAVGVAVGAAFAVILFVWFAWYRLAGAGQATTWLAQGFVAVTGVVLIYWHRLGWRRIGLGGANLARAAVALGLAYAVLFVLGFGLSAASLIDTPVLRSGYSLPALLDNWLLTGLGEELLFAGAIFTLVARRLPRQRLWLAVLIVAVLFALWHLPGHLAMGREGGALFGRLGLHLVSWLIFGAIYALSGNLWLVALAHGSTDYALSPLVQGEPVLGLVFFAVLVAAGWYSGRKQ